LILRVLEAVLRLIVSVEWKIKSLNKENIENGW
jgi:hypothetical protein